MKYLVLIVVLVAIAMVIAAKARAAGKDEIVVRRVKSMDAEIPEEWERVTDDEEVLGVSVSRTSHPEWKWQVCVTVAEFVREEPLESSLVRHITSAMKNVDGVRAVAHEDREVWLIKGDASGEALVRAVSSALDSLAPQLRGHLESL